MRRRGGLADGRHRAITPVIGEAASLLEKYFAGYRREAEARKWRRTHPSPSRKAESSPLYDEAKAQAKA